MKGKKEERLQQSVEDSKIKEWLKDFHEKYGRWHDDQREFNI